MKVVKAILIAGAASLGSWSVFAHHSYAMFDQTMQLSVSGTMAKVDWSNPYIALCSSENVARCLRVISATPLAEKNYAP